MDQVTAKDRETVEKEAGLSRTSLRGSLSLGKAGKTVWVDLRR